PTPCCAPFRQARHRARCEERRWAMRPSRTRTLATGGRRLRRSPRQRRAGRRHGSCEFESDGLVFVLVCYGSCLQPAQRRVASTYVVFDMPAIHAGSSIWGVRVLLVEDEPYMAEAIRNGLRLEAIAADIAGDGDTALELLSVNAYDIAVLDRDIPGPSGDEIAERIVASGSGMPIVMLTAADRLDDKATGFELGADDYLTKPFELRELVLRLRALDRRRAQNRPPVREIAGL